MAFVYSASFAVHENPAAYSYKKAAERDADRINKSDNSTKVRGKGGSVTEITATAEVPDWKITSSSTLYV